MEDARKLLIGTRGSPLALAQTEWVVHALSRRLPDVRVEIVTIRTAGDKRLDMGVSSGWSGKGVFTKEIEDALLAKRIDLAVHSLKDLPTQIPRGLTIAAVTDREEDRDVLVLCDTSDHYTDGKDALDGIRLAGRVGTSSLRRATQIIRQRPDLSVIPLRGNLDTRLQKLDREGLDAIVVAAAGLKRLGIEKTTAYLIPYSVSLPAVGQGILALETRATDRFAKEVAATIHSQKSEMEMITERAFMAAMEGGCRVPLGARAWANGKSIVLEGMVASTRGFKFIRERKKGSAAAGETIGKSLAKIFMRLGARGLLKEARQGVAS